MYALGLAVFAAASLACGVAPSPGTLIAAKGVQGLAAALLAPQVHGCRRRRAAHPRVHRPRAGARPRRRVRAAHRRCAAPGRRARQRVAQHLPDQRPGRRGGAPLVAPALFREPVFRVGSGLALVYTPATASFFLYLQQGRGLSALESGLLFVALGAGYLAASTRATAVAARLGRQVLALGALIQAAGCLLLMDTLGHGIAWLIPGLALAGAGMGSSWRRCPRSCRPGGRTGTRPRASWPRPSRADALGVAVIGTVFSEPRAAFRTPSGRPRSQPSARLPWPLRR